MAEEISQSHLLSSTSSEASGRETTPPPTSQSAPPLPIQAAQPPSREDIEWGGDVEQATSRLVALLTANGENTLDTNTLELGLGTFRAVAYMNRLAMGEVPAAVALLYKESEVMVHSPMMVSNQQRGGVAGTGREGGAAERGDREEQRQGSTDRKRRNMRPAAFTLARKMLGVKEQYTHIRGFVAQGHVNGPFCAAVCAALVGRVTLDSLRRSGASRNEGRARHPKPPGKEGGGRGWQASNPQLMWAVQMVLAAPYPLVEVDELFVVTGPEGAEVCRLAAMRRNECCVTIDNKRRKFLLVTGSGVETSK
ncbi:unnamed protein product [Arctia plantaginis]|uniref:Uncharacterized protein n=1 Tax=Arctia plantaginis TaxID=874455 RepID=A0A8S0ZK55_ARCPL|nr:unnamed protein product [Arctia plantaginis]